MLRDQVAEERKKRELAANENHRAQTAIYERMRGMEQELLARIKEQRESQLQALTDFENEKTRLIKNGGSSVEDASNLVRSMLGSLERKFEEEVGNRVRDLG